MTVKKQPKKVTVLIAPDERVLIIKANAFYRLGEQHGDIVHSGALICSHQVKWCHVSQEFKEVTK